MKLLLMLGIGDSHNRDCCSDCDHLVHDPETPQEATRKPKICPDAVSEAEMGELESDWLYAKGQLQFEITTTQ